MKKRLVIVRHAHRDIEVHSDNNGLSDKGKEQVQKLIPFARKRLKDERPVFLSSPKKRCIETLTPIAKAFGEKVEIDDLLTEQGSMSTYAFEEHIEMFLDRFKFEGPDVLVICTHGDWIPEAVQKLTGQSVALKKAGWCEIEYESGHAELTWLMQKAD